jgi:hypothetical protein
MDWMWGEGAGKTEDDYEFLSLSNWLKKVPVSDRKMRAED